MKHLLYLLPVMIFALTGCSNDDDDDNFVTCPGGPIVASIEYSSPEIPAQGLCGEKYQYDDKGRIMHIDGVYSTQMMASTVANGELPATPNDIMFVKNDRAYDFSYSEDCVTISYTSHYNATDTVIWDEALHFDEVHARGEIIAHMNEDRIDSISTRQDMIKSNNMNKYIDYKLKYEDNRLVQIVVYEYIAAERKESGHRTTSTYNVVWEGNNITSFALGSSQYSSSVISKIQFKYGDALGFIPKLNPFSMCMGNVYGKLAEQGMLGTVTENLITAYTFSNTPEDSKKWYNLSYEFNDGKPVSCTEKITENREHTTCEMKLTWK